MLHVSGKGQSYLLCAFWKADQISCSAPGTVRTDFNYQDDCKSWRKFANGSFGASFVRNFKLAMFSCYTYSYSFFCPGATPSSYSMISSPPPTGSSWSRSWSPRWNVKFDTIEMLWQSPALVHNLRRICYAITSWTLFTSLLLIAAFQQSFYGDETGKVYPEPPTNVEN